MNQIQKYFRYRQSLIDQYKKGDMTKREYLQMNYDAVINNGINPFKNIDTVEKALYNYQYYNALAKQMKSISTESDMDYEIKKDYRENGFGKKMIKYLVDNYKSKYKKLIVGTTENNIPFYVKQCFDKYEKTINNFFVDNYNEKIKDGDLVCTDLIYYSKDLKKK